MSARRSALDGAAGRIGAAIVLLLVIASLTAIHWEDLFGPDPAEVAADDPVARCIAERSADIEAMIEENPSMAGRRETLLARVPPMCEDMLGSGGGNSPPLPGQ
ncbi:hypothetical protein [Aquibaculum sediminis]|uniref:hypothetical protein n=1 Tax=Aquibaculum sediminis TaxID=3231907 RepID=UPI00345614C2